MTRACHTAIAFAAAMLCAAIAHARVLDVGPTHVLKVPSQAATIATDGDTIRIDPGTYADCAVWRASRLTIEATGPGVRLAGKTCDGLGIFVILGNDTTIDGITFADATVLAHNGAGIRAAGRNLTIEHSRFENNENGILAGGDGLSVLRITNSTFIGNGACIEACAHGVYAGEPILLLDIEHCVFLANRVGHHIKSRALNTIVEDSRIEDGPTGTASYLIDIPQGGNVLIQGNTMEKGPLSENHETAISIGSEGVRNPTGSIIVRDNTFRNDFPGTVIFVRNDTAAAPALIDNTIVGNVIPLAKSPPAAAKK